MVNLTRLLCGTAQPADHLRYGQGSGAPASAATRKPIVVWNITRRCNLHCLHCYSDSEPREYPGELTWDEIKKVIDDLAAFEVPGVLLSGGEPTTHPRFLAIASYARRRGLRLTLSTNGTRINRAMAEYLRHLGFAYVGISLDGIGDVHDRFRGRVGAFDMTLEGIRNCRAAGQKVGLRLTLTPHTVETLPEILNLIEVEGIDRVCFYHLVYSGRGSELATLTPEQTRSALDLIMDRVRQWHESGQSREVLTVDQPADGAYLWMKLTEKKDPRAAEALRLLKWNGGGSHGSGIGISNIDSTGHVHPDQFWQTHSLGSVREKPFSKIWQDSKDSLLAGLRERRSKLEGRCGRCRFQDICGGGFRVRALQRYGNPWAEDPDCYLSEKEISD